MEKMDDRAKAASGESTREPGSWVDNHWQIKLVYDGARGYAFSACYLGVLMAQGWLRTEDEDFAHTTALNMGIQVMVHG